MKKRKRQIDRLHIGVLPRASQLQLAMEKYGGLKEKKVDAKAALYPPGVTMIGQEAGAPFISASGQRLDRKQC